MGECKFFDKNFVLLDIVFIQFRHAMPVGKTVFSQLMSLLPEHEFKKCIDKYNGDFHAVDFTCRDLFMVMSFFRYNRECRVCTDMDCRMRLSVACHSEKDVSY